MSVKCRWNIERCVTCMRFPHHYDGTPCGGAECERRNNKDRRKAELPDHPSQEWVDALLGGIRHGEIDADQNDGAEGDCTMKPIKISQEQSDELNAINAYAAMAKKSLDRWWRRAYEDHALDINTLYIVDYVKCTIMERPTDEPRK